MSRHSTAWLAPLVLLSLARPAAGFDPRQVDVLTLRLGMTETEATERLLAQGVRAEAIGRQRVPCPEAPGRTCLTTLTAPTRDGVLVLHFRPDGRAAASLRADLLVYTLHVRSSGEPAMVRASVLARYGVPSVMEPLTWCAQVAEDGRCPADQPRLTLRPGTVPTIAGTLSLTEP